MKINIQAKCFIVELVLKLRENVRYEFNRSAALWFYEEIKILYN